MGELRIAANAIDLRPDLPPFLGECWVVNLASSGLSFRCHCHCERVGRDIAQR